MARGARIHDSNAKTLKGAQAKARVAIILGGHKTMDVVVPMVILMAMTMVLVLILLMQETDIE